jgi:uncharacterized NAD(P)/FAD-binding protein YdhS
VAFAARHSRLVLNTRVANMSVFEHDRSHLLRWLWAKDLPEHLAGSIPPSGHAFVSRGLYGRYVSEVIDEAAAGLPSGIALERVGRSVHEAIEEPARVRLMLDDGSTRTTDVVVLCTGNLLPELPAAPGAGDGSARRLIANPWDEAAVAGIGPDDAVLVLGSGLTMAVDLPVGAHMAQEPPSLRLGQPLPQALCVYSESIDHVAPVETFAPGHG